MFCITKSIDLLNFLCADLPLVLSGKSVAFIDPHRATVPSSDKSPAGTKVKLSKVFKHAGHASTFHGIFGVDKAKTEYNGTLFRFPLRKPNNQSKIKSDHVTTEEIKGTLFESLKAEASYMLLFMKNVTKVSFFEWNKSLQNSEKLFTVQIEKNCISDILKEKSLFCKKQSTMVSSEVLIQLYDIAVNCFESHTSSEVECSTRWLILNVLGRANAKYDKKPTFPSIGLACQIPAVNLNQSCCCSTFPENLSKIAESLLRSHTDFQSMTLLPRKVEGSLNGCKAFCFLPLPLHTYLPVHIHGSFAVSRNRRSIAWQGVDIRNDDTEWNEDILKSMVAPAYSLLLLLHCKLFRYESPLESTVPNECENAYALWPVYDEVKNETIWRNLLKPVLSVLTSGKVLWSDVRGGCWVSFDEAYFALKDSPEIVISVLLQAGLPVVILPPRIYDTLCHIPCLDKILEERAIKPQDLRKHFPKNILCESRKGLEVLLNFLLSGIDYRSISEIYGIPLLPLMDGSCCSFAKKDPRIKKYVLPKELQNFYESFAAGTKDIVVDFHISLETYKKLESIYASTQLEIVDCKILFQDLVKASIFKWACRSSPDGAIAWTPGLNGHPSKKWLTDMWDFIGNKECYNVIIGLPIVPVRNEQNVYSLARVPEKNTGAMLCYISLSIYSQKLASALRKLQFVIVDQRLTCECSLFPFLSLKEFLKMLPTNAVQYVETMTREERDSLLSYIVKAADHLSHNDISKIRNLPIFRVTNREFKYSYLPLETGNSSISPFLRPKENVVTNLLLPPGVLDNYDNETLRFFSQVNVNTLSFSIFIVNHCIPFAKKLLQTLKLEEGNNIILALLDYLENDSRWQMKEYKVIIKCLKKSKIICNKFRKYACANEMYSKCKEIEILVDNFEMHTPHRQYSSCSSVLLSLGLKTWDYVKNDRDELLCLLKSIDKSSFKDTESELMYARSCLLLEEF